MRFRQDVDHAVSCRLYNSCYPQPTCERAVRLNLLNGIRQAIVGFYQRHPLKTMRTKNFFSFKAVNLAALLRNQVEAIEIRLIDMILVALNAGRNALALNTNPFAAILTVIQQLAKHIPDS